MNILYSKKIIILTIIFVSLVAHWTWLVPGIFSFGDTGYIYNETIRETLDSSVNTSWYSYANFGRSFSQPYSYPMSLVSGLLANISSDQYYVLLFIYFLPITILSALGSYILIYEITKERLFSTLGALFYISNTYFLTLQTEHLILALGYAFVPFVVLVTIRWLNALESQRWFSMSLILALVGTTQIVIEARLFYIVFVFILIPLAIISKKFLTRVFWYSVFVACLVGFALNAFWIGAMYFGASDVLQRITERPLFGSYLQSILHSITLHRNSWTGEVPTPFLVNEIPMHFWLVPVLILVGAIIHMKGCHRQVYIFWLIIAIVGITLSKQNTPPFSTLYEWLFREFPGFKMFRESSKFFLLTAISYSILISLSLQNIKKLLKSRGIAEYRNYVGTVSITLAVIFCYNFLPLVTKNIGTMFVHRTIPSDYLLLKNILHEDNDFHRSLWIPAYSRWGYYNSRHPFIHGAQIISYNWQMFSSFESKKVEKNLVSPLVVMYSNFLIDSSSVKYIIIPGTNSEEMNIFFHYGGKDNPNIRQWYIDQLDALPYLKRIDIGTKELVVYENENYSPYLRAFPTLIGYDSFQNLDEKYTFSSSVLKEDFDFVEHREFLPFPTRGVRHIFENITPANISERGITETFEAVPGSTFLYARTPGESVSVNNSNITLSPGGRSENFTRFPIETSADSISVTYHDPEKSLSNRIPNSSFEDGLWKEKVGDCNNFDKNGLLDMKLNRDAHSEGEASLELHATRHIACTNQKFPVSGGRTSLFSFDYQSPNAKQAGFHISFDGPNKSAISEKIPFKKSPSSSTLDFGLSTVQTAPEKLPWFSFTKQITIPDGATTASLHVYSYSTDNETDIVTRYDNFSFIELPDIADRYYLVSDPETNFVEPRDITFASLNPTKKLVHIKGATTPFYLAMSESYHPQWQAHLSNAKIGMEVKSEKSKVKSANESFDSELSTESSSLSTFDLGLSTFYSRFFASWIPWVTPDRIPDDHHFELNGFLNGWYVDPSALCAEVEGQKPITSKVGDENSKNTFDFGLLTLDSSRLKDGCTLNADGSYDIELTLEFFPQRWFYLGLLISGTTLLGCIGYLVYDAIRRRRQNKQPTTYLERGTRNFSSF